MKLAIALLSLAMTVCAAGIDGRWSAELTARNKKAVDKKTTFSLDLKAQDGKVTGTVYLTGARKRRPLTIRDGRIAGNQVTFTTEQKNKKADVILVWTATLDGNQMNGTRSRDGARKGQPFTARRAN